MRHTYISTACQHARHKRCKVKCKFCTATCLCKCHAEHPSDRLRKHLDRKFGQEEKADVAPCAPTLNISTAPPTAPTAQFNRQEIRYL